MALELNGNNLLKHEFLEDGSPAKDNLLKKKLYCFDDRVTEVEENLKEMEECNH
jgi:hypothetical protein